MSETLADLLGGHPLQLDLVDVGEFRQPRSLEGWVHRKTTPYTIAAQAYEGSYEVRYQGRHAVAKEGRFFLVPAHVPVEITHHDGRRGVMKARWIHFRFSIFDTIDFLSLFELPLCLPPEESAELGALVGQALSPSGPEKLGPLRLVGHHAMATRALCLISRVSRLKNDTLTITSGWQRLAPVLRHIRQNIAQPLSITSLARLACLSEPQFHAVFKKALRMPPMKYVRAARLEAASCLLVSTGKTLAEIAEATGFSDPFHLSHAFRAHFNMAPRTYREQMRLYASG